MLNTEEFIKRLEFLLEHFGESASSFADKVGVQRSSISHLLSGRNKPSLDFILKINQLYPEVNLYWLIEGTTPFLKNEEPKPTSKIIEQPPTLFSENGSSQELASNETENEIQVDVAPIEFKTAASNKARTTQSNNKPIEKIVFFYNDGTFYAYHPLEDK